MPPKKRQRQLTGSTKSKTTYIRAKPRADPAPTPKPKPKPAPKPKAKAAPKAAPAPATTFTGMVRSLVGL